MGTLFVVATPIGNLEDITLRALRILREASLIVAEDTRTARKLLTHFGIRNRLLSYNEHNMAGRTPRILAALESGDVALVSEAGTPGVSDPGFELVRAAIAAAHRVVPVPGPAAVIAALTASGLPLREFTFAGFPKRRPGDRRRQLQTLAARPETIVFFESPQRLRKTLADMLEAFGDRRIAVCREMTKAFEEVFRGTLSQALEHFQDPRGEFTLVVEGASAEPPAAAAGDADVTARLRALREAGVRGNEAVRQVCRSTGRPRREVYALWVNLGEGAEARRPRAARR